MSDNKKIIVSFLPFGPVIEDTLDLVAIIDQRDNPVKTGILADQLEDFFRPIMLNNLDEDVIDRYKKATKSESHTIVTTTQNEIVNRIVRPLRLSKKYYALGEFSAVLALCGMCSEMLCLLVWRMNSVHLNDEIGGRIRINERQEKQLFGKKFEDLEQSRRIRVLRCLQFIDDEQQRLFAEIAKKRNKILHRWEIEKKPEEESALDCLNGAMKLFSIITQIKLADASSLSVNPKLLSYLSSNETGDE